MAATKPNVARDWARVAKRAGQKYLVMTTKHHEGFCLFNSQLTDYCAPKHAAGRDLIAEFVENVRAEGLTPGFYYSSCCEVHFGRSCTGQQ